MPNAVSRQNFRHCNGRYGDVARARAVAMQARTRAPIFSQASRRPVPVLLPPLSVTRNVDRTCRAPRLRLLRLFESRRGAAGTISAFRNAQRDERRRLPSAARIDLSPRRCLMKTRGGELRQLETAAPNSRRADATRARLLSQFSRDEERLVASASCLTCCAPAPVCRGMSLCVASPIEAFAAMQTQLF